MTNANVEQVVTAVDGQTLTLKYKDGEKIIFVPANTPIVVYVLKSDLKPGAKVFIQAARWNVTRSRVAGWSGWSKPPM
jgi:hypothetical protein